MRVFIGYDSREDIAYQVCKKSILKHSPTSKVYPIVMDSLRAEGTYTRGKDVLASTAFATTRYLTPLMAGYKGYALYMDSDMLATQDVDNIMLEVTDNHPVWCVQHDFTPKDTFKMDGKRQVIYPRKGWASLMLFNCDHNLTQALTPQVINNVPIPYLNELRWAEQAGIGSLNPKWNFLVRHHVSKDKDAHTLTVPTEDTPAIIHWTYGGQWLPGQPDQDYDALWRSYNE